MLNFTEDILKQIRIGEDTTIELKDIRFKGNRVFDPHDKSMADELAAMANTASGVFLLGIDDKTKIINGIPLEKLDDVERWIRNIANDLIEPQLNCIIRKLPIFQDNEEKIIIRIDVPKSLFVHKSPNGYFNRIGSSRRSMGPDVLARLFQQRSQARIIRFDEQAVYDAKTGNLDKSLWEKFKTSLSPQDDSEFLLKLKLLTTDEDKNILPTVSGILMATKNPEIYISNAYIQAVAYSGIERNAAFQIDAMDITGPLNEQILQAYKFVEKNMRIGAVKIPNRVEKPQYALTAIFEAIVNAVAHRDYSIGVSKIRLHMFSDRIELFSPGAIPNTMTVESLALRQATRNELLSSLLARCPIQLDSYSGKRSFIMDKRGEGVPIIFNDSKAISNKMPEYNLIDDSELLLTIFSA